MANPRPSSAGRNRSRQFPQAQSTAAIDLFFPPLAHLVALANRQHIALFDALLDKSELASGTQWSVLTFVRETPGITAAELAKIMTVTPQASQSVLMQLESKGFISRRKEGRCVRTKITTSGRAALVAAEPAVTEFRSATTGGLDRNQREVLESLLTIYVNTLAEQ